MKTAMGRKAAGGKTIKVLHVITSLGKGGAEAMLYNLLAHRRRAGFDHSVVSLTGEGSYGPAIRRLGVPVLALRLKNPPSAPSSIVRAIGRVRRYAPDIVQGWMYHGNIAASLLRACGPADRRVFWNVRHSLHFFGEETLPTRIVVRLNRLLSRAADCCVFNSRVSLGQHAAFGFAAGRMAAVPNGFDTDRFRPDPGTRAVVRRTLGLAPGELVIGLVGRYHPLKDYGCYLKAITVLREAAPDLRFTSVMAGKGLTRDNAGLRAAFDGLPADVRVLAVGESDDVPALMSAFDFLCLPSRSEAFPNVVGEAMAAGLPCFVTDVGDAAYLVGDTGIVVPPRDPRALAAGLRKALSMDSSEREARGTAARRRVQSLFSIEAVVAQYERLYEQAMSGGA